MTPRPLQTSTFTLGKQCQRFASDRTRCRSNCRRIRNRVFCAVCVKDCPIFQNVLQRWTAKNNFVALQRRHYKMQRVVASKRSGISTCCKLEVIQPLSLSRTASCIEKYTQRCRLGGPTTWVISPVTSSMLILYKISEPHGQAALSWTTGW